MASEVICLSSDDENTTKKINHKTIKKSFQNYFIKENEEKKRKLPLFPDLPGTSNSSEPLAKKRACLKSQPLNGKPNSMLNKNEILLKSSKPSTSGLQTVNKTSSQEHELSKPLLVVKEKHPVNIYSGNEDLFAAFIGQVFQRDRSDDMVKIVEKLKRRYEHLDPVYAKSEVFAELLNEKREILLNPNSVLFKHISEVNEEMKKRKLGKCNHNDFNTRPAIMIKYDKSEENQNESDEEVATEYPGINQRNKEKIKKLEKCMKIVQKRINKLEETEVDFEDECDSSFMKTERYKKRMVELYSLWCKYTNNDETANRSYLRPKHFNKLTGIVTVDQAINSFINSKLTKKRKGKANNDCEIFPDYIDILNVVHKHNIQNNLDMDKRSEKEAAKNAFIKLGEYLQRVRREDLFDSFSSFYENDDDPVKKDSELASQFIENRTIGVKKMNAIFDEYTKKQEELKTKKSDKSKNQDGSDSDNDDEYSENNSDDEDEDDDERDVSKLELTDISDSESDTKEVAMDNDNVKQTNVSPKVDEKSKESIIDKSNSDGKKTNDDDHNNVKNKNKQPKSTVIRVEKKQDEILIKDSEIKIKTVNQVDKVREESGDSNEAVDDQPLLKLRSFAKPPKFWQNSQDGESDPERSQQNSSKTPIEVIDVEDSDELPTLTNVTKKSVKTPPRIVKIVHKKVHLKPLPNKTVIIKNTKNQNSIILSKNVRLLPLGGLIGTTSKPNNKIVQSSAVSTTVNRVINPMARETSSNQQLVNLVGVVYSVNNKVVKK